MITLAKDKFTHIPGFAYYHSFQIIETVSEANLTSYSMAPALFSPGLKRPGHKVQHSPLSLPRLRMSGTIPLITLYAFMAWTGKLYLSYNKPKF
jgi:hypothetical protein